MLLRVAAGVPGARRLVDRGCGALGMSIVAFILLAVKHALALPAQQGQLPTINILWLVPVMIFGFALCPYLDITFHRARQAMSPRDGRVAFALGFGGFFFS
jgi:hypothetical protein